MSESSALSRPAAVAAGAEASWLESRSLISVLHRYARRIVGREDLAWDAVQETLITALRERDASEAPSMPWLLRTVRHRCLHSRRSETRREAYERRACEFQEVIAKGSPRDPLGALERRELSRALDAALSELPPEQCEAFLMHVVLGQNYTTIANAQGVPIGTVRSRIARARRSLQAKLEGAQRRYRPEPRGIAARARALVSLAVVVGTLGLTALAPAPAAAAESKPRVLSISHHDRILFGKTLRRVAVGDSTILDVQIIDAREVLALGRGPGRTSLHIWFDDGSVIEMDFLVQRDLSSLEDALREIHDSIRPEMASDRDAVILRGRVPDVAIVRAAEAATRAWLGASARSRRAAGAPLVRSADGPAEVPPASSEGAAAPNAEETATVRIEGEVIPSTAVINLILVDRLPLRVEERVLEAARAMGADRVIARRIVRGDIPDDAADTLVLDGRVADQVQLVRVVQIAARLFLGRDAREDEIRVIADESGALVGGSATRVTDAASSSSGFARDLGLGRIGRLENRIENNIARATLLSVADGRLLSMLTVDDIAQVRIDVRLYEVNRTRLRSYAPSVSGLYGDRNVPPLRPSESAEDLFGDAAPAIGGNGAEDVQGIISSLGGAFTGELSLTASNAVVDAVLSYLERNGVARSLARPQLVVLSGETAIFQVGGEIPIQVAFAPALGGGTSAVPGVFSAVEFRTFGIQLGVRPLVDPSGTITIDVSPQIVLPDATLTEQLRTTTGTDPVTTAFEVRSLRTTARLGDGQALVLGGLISATASETTTGTPGLRDVPLVGKLFEGFGRQGDEVELVITLNPVIEREPSVEAALWLQASPRELIPARYRATE